MKRFIPSESRSEWSWSWPSRWSGGGGPIVVLFGLPADPPTRLLKRLRGIVRRRNRPGATRAHGDNVA